MYIYILYILHREKSTPVVKKDSIQNKNCNCFIIINYKHQIFSIFRYFPQVLLPKSVPIFLQTSFALGGTQLHEVPISGNKFLHLGPRCIKSWKKIYQKMIMFDISPFLGLFTIVYLVFSSLVCDAFFLPTLFTQHGGEQISSIPWMWEFVGPQHPRLTSQAPKKNKKNALLGIIKGFHLMYFALQKQTSRDPTSNCPA